MDLAFTVFLCALMVFLIACLVAIYHKLDEILQVLQKIMQIESIDREVTQYDLSAIKSIRLPKRCHRQ